MPAKTTTPRRGETRRPGRPALRTYKPTERRQIPVDITQANVARLDRMASRKGVSRSALIRSLLDV